MVVMEIEMVTGEKIHIQYINGSGLKCGWEASCCKRYGFERSKCNVESKGWETVEPESLVEKVVSVQRVERWEVIFIGGNVCRQNVGKDWTHEC